MNLSKREYALLGLLMVVGGTYLIYCLIFQPVNLQINQIKTDNQSLMTQIQVLEPQANWAGDSWMEKQQVWGDYEAILLKIPNTAMVSDVIDFIQQSASESSLTIKSLNYKKSSQAPIAMDANKYGNDKADLITPTVQSGNFQLTASGTHLNLISLLQRIENAPRIYRINSISFNVLRNVQPPVELELDTPGDEANSESAGSLIDTQESQAYDINQMEINLDFTIFFDTR